MINFRLVRHLWLFLAVAEEKNYGRAAKRLGMSQPPLTAQIKTLEQSLKLKLFERSQRGTQLTPAGAAILPAVRKFADQLERLELAVQEALSGHAGLLTIGAISHAMMDVLPPLLERLKTERPGLTVSVREIDSADAVAALESGDIDLAFARLEDDLGTTIQAIPMSEDRVAVALPRTHPLATASRVRLASLAEEQMVMFSRQISPVFFDSLIAACQANGFSPRILHEVRSVASQLAFVGCGQGIALVPSMLRKAAPENVVLRPLKEDLKVVATSMAWDTRRSDPLVSYVVETMSSMVQAQKGRRAKARNAA
jgi:DNA-binding transcriptional LysR family regulator